MIQSGETFRYTDTGSEGLLNSGKKILLIQSSGSIYTVEPALMAIDYGPEYIKSVFAFMGITDFSVVRAEGTNLLGGDKEKIISNGKIQIDKYIIGNF